MKELLSDILIPLSNKVFERDGDSAAAAAAAVALDFAVLQYSMLLRMKLNTAATYITKYKPANANTKPKTGMGKDDVIIEQSDMLS